MKKRWERLALLLLLSVLVCLSAGCGKRGAVGAESVTVEIRCDTVWKNWDLLDPALREPGVIPRDGAVLQAAEVTLNRGDTVFSLLLRASAEGGIELQYTGTADKQNVYISGIGLLGEFDCGTNSGWLYSVNGIFPSIGCSAYTLAVGDVIRFLYTCDGGPDVGSIPIA